MLKFEHLVPCSQLVMARGFWSNERIVPTNGKHGIKQTKRDGDSVPVLLTAEEMADLLRTSRTAIYAMVAREQLPGVIRIGRRVLFRRQDVMTWLSQL